MSLNKLLIATALMVSVSGVALADEMAAPMAASGTTAPAKKHHAHKHHAKSDAMAPMAASGK